MSAFKKGFLNKPGKSAPSLAAGISQQVQSLSMHDQPPVNMDREYNSAHKYGIVPTTPYEKVCEIMYGAQQMVDSSEIVDWLVSQLKAILKNRELTYIRAIGIGAFHFKTFGALQLAVIQALRRKFPRVQVIYQELSIIPSEMHWLVSEGIQVLNADDLLKNPLPMKKNQVTLCFTPHLPNYLYNSLLTSYWKLDDLKNMILIGNSFVDIEETYGEAMNELPALRDFIMKSNEISFLMDPKNAPLRDAFDWTYIHYLAEKVIELASLKDFDPEYTKFFKIYEERKRAEEEEDEDDEN